MSRIGKFGPFATLFLAIGCTHPINIVGDGDIVSSTGTRDCAKEDAPCDDGNHIINYDVDYVESYTAVPRYGSQFSHWHQCTPSGNDETQTQGNDSITQAGDTCSYDVSKETVEDNAGVTAATTTAHFEKHDFPRTAAFVHASHVFDNISSSSFRDALVKHDIASLGMWRGYESASTLESFDQVVDDIRARADAAGNDSMLLGKYQNVMQVTRETTDDATSDIRDEVDDNNWWYLDEDDYKTWQWSGAWSINISDHVGENSEMQRYPQWYAQRSYDEFFDNTNLDFMFADDTHSTPRFDDGSPPAGDINNDGVNEGTVYQNLDATVPANSAHSQKYREGHRAYWDALRALRPDIEIIANQPGNFTDVMGGMQHTEYAGQADAIFEGPIGYASWSPENWEDWEKVMDAYYHYFKPGRLKNGIIAVLTGADSQSDYQLFRYALTSVMMNDGYIYHTHSDSDFLRHLNTVWWYDEYDQDCGQPVDNPPTIGTPNFGVGAVYKREYENCLVLVNPKVSSTNNGGQVTINIPSGWKRFDATDYASQDTVRNDGSTSSFDLPPRDGVVLVKI